MITLKKYISERILRERKKAEVNADVIFQKMLDVLDHAHIDFEERSISFHIGRIIKNSNLDLAMVIRNSEESSVKMGKKREGGQMTIVVNVKSELPDRQQIDSFLAKDRSRAQEIKGFISKYLNDFHSKDEPSLINTRYEEEAEANSTLEDRYEKMVKTLKDRIEDYKGEMEELKGHMDTENTGDRETAKRAIKHLATEQFGDNLDEFKKIAMELLGVHKMLSKENKDKLSNRLDSFYDQKIKPLLAK